MVTTGKKSHWFWSGEEPEWLVIMTVLLALVIGGLVMYLSIGQTSGTTLERMSLRYPARWAAQDVESSEVGAQDLVSRSSVTVSIIGELDPKTPVALDDIVAARAFELAQEYQLFRVLETRDTSVDRQPALLLRYAFVQEASESSYLSSLPEVIQGEDYIIPYQGKIYLVSLQDDANRWTLNSFQQIMSSIKLR
jgi:hypothetical protein